MDIADYKLPLLGESDATEQAAAWNNKAAGIVSYGSVGGARAAEHLRGILGELSVADVRVHSALSLFTDFNNGVFTPADLHLVNLNGMIDQVVAWSGALQVLR